MITFHIISLFPEIFKSIFSASIIKRAQDKKLIRIKFHNPRDFAKDKHKTADDKPYGGGPGMVIKVDVIVRAVLNVLNEINKKTNRTDTTIRTSRTKIILLSARGKQFNQKMARDWAKKYKNIVLICGHYEGIDERVKKILRAEEISIGPYILSGGEIAAMATVDAISRHIPGVLGKIESLEEKKGSYPVYTRPETFIFKGKKYAVPKVLLSGNHKKISEWRIKHGKMK
jgi:tRNA (guanine37-N1)-methyltransferase